jgi:hypothetical protein
MAGPESRKIATTTSMVYARMSAVPEGTLLIIEPNIGIGFPDGAIIL